MSEQLKDLASSPTPPKRQQVTKETIFIESFFEQCLSTIKHQATQKDVTIYTTFDKGLHEMQADPVQLKCAIQTFLSHSLAQVLPHGAIGLDVIGERLNQSLHVIIWDTSDGTLNEQLNQALNHTNEHPATGLEKAIKIIYEHEGSVSVRTTSKQSTSLTLSLPWQPHSQLDNHQKRLPDAGDSRHILLAEDNPDNANPIIRYLRACGFIVGHAENGRNAVEYIQANHPDLVLMDICMPEVDGLTAIETIRSSADLQVAQIPIVALTALSMSSDQQACLDAGASGFISKPVSLRWLYESIQSHLNAALEDEKAELKSAV